MKGVNLKMSAKNRDEHNRWRNKTVAFRMSPEESNELDTRVKLSGLTKQDYLINRALQAEKAIQQKRFITKQKTRHRYDDLCR